LASPASNLRASTQRNPARRIARSFGFAFEGLWTILRTQPNFWVHLSAAAVALGGAFTLGFTVAEIALVVLTIAVVLIVEAVNTALETLCDLVSPGQHPLIKRAKDISAAAVLIAALAAISVALLLFGPRLANLLVR
jgi:diacylglycerol kinase